MSLFLEDDQIARLTGRKTKTKQIEWLRREGIPFRVNARGHPIVTRSVIEGTGPQAKEQPRTWMPRVIGV